MVHREGEYWQSYTDAITDELDQYEHVSEDEPISVRFNHHAWLHESLKFQSTVIDCDDDEPPEYTNETNGASK